MHHRISDSPSPGAPRRPTPTTPAAVALAALACAALSASPLAAQSGFEWTSTRPDGHAPIGVMGDHTHSAGEFMLSYRFMRMNMDGNRTGTDQVTPEQVLGDFMVTPLNMPMNMHMAGLMYAPSDRVTLMGMLPYISQTMDHVTRMGGEFQTSSSGVGDISVSGLVGLWTEGSSRMHLNLGMSFPTGSIDETDVTPASNGNQAQLPYPMQIGSGTYDLRPGLTVLGMSPSTSWGLQGTGVVRLGENDRGYTMGDGVEGTGWVAFKLSDMFSLSGRVLARWWGDYEGADPAYGNLMMVPTVRPDLRGGTRVDVPVGFNFEFASGALKGHRLAAEFAIPVYQDLNGPQLESDWTLTVGWQKAFAPIGHHD